MIGSDVGVICHSSYDKVCGLLSFRAECSIIWGSVCQALNCLRTVCDHVNMFAPMLRTLKIQDWAKRNNARRIDVIVRDTIAAAVFLLSRMLGALRPCVAAGVQRDAFDAGASARQAAAALPARSHGSGKRQATADRHADFSCSEEATGIQRANYGNRWPFHWFSHGL